MKRGYLVFVFLFVLACLPFAMAPPAQASGTMVLNNHATITTAGPAVLDHFGPANGDQFAEAIALNNYMEMTGNPKIHRYVEDDSLAKPWTRSMEVSEILIFDEDFLGTKGNANNFD